jgi:hypothetical protein
MVVHGPRRRVRVLYTHHHVMHCNTLYTQVHPGLSVCHCGTRVHTGEHVCSVCAAHTHQSVRTPIPAVPWSYEDSPEINYVNIQGQFFMGTDFQSI